MAKKTEPAKAAAGKAKPDRLTRAVILVWTAAGAIVLLTLFKTVKAVGLFSFAAAVSPGVCHAVPLDGPGDLAFEGKSGTLFIAAARAGAPAASDGIYALVPGGRAPVKLKGTPPDFHPGALSIGYNADGAPSLMAVNHHRDGTVSIEVYTVLFDARGASLKYESSVQGGLARRAEGIAALGDNRFYLAANPTTSDALAWADRWFLLGRAGVLFFNGQVFRQAVNGLSAPSAVAVSPDGQRLFIASPGERRVIALARDPYGGGLTEQDSLSLPMRPERISVDANGGLWIAGPNRLPALGAASAVVRVALGANGKFLNQQTVWADGGKAIAAATAAVKVPGHLFIGSSHDGKLLDCAVK